ncbi:transposase [Spartinivicinus poritis]|uniref:transposase n=1 Tax=Spartinivicinus poritis TaxID=2994640 RepID=UPI003CC90CFB
MPLYDFLAILECLEKLYPLATTIYVILDNARYHFSEPVLSWVKTSRVHLVPLPSYSPDLNLIERFWKVFKKKVLYNKFYETFTEFKKACSRFFIHQHAHADEIYSIMGNGLSELACE